MGWIMAQTQLNERLEGGGLEEEGQDGQVVLHPHHQETGAIYCNNAKHLLCILRPGQNDVIVSYFSKN